MEIRFLTSTGAADLPAKENSALDFAIEDASAALPQNCQTTRWIVGS
jgi:hypothetical protein